MLFYFLMKYQLSQALDIYGDLSKVTHYIDVCFCFHLLVSIGNCPLSLENCVFQELDDLHCCYGTKFCTTRAPLQGHYANGVKGLLVYISSLVCIRWG